MKKIILLYFLLLTALSLYSQTNNEINPKEKNESKFTFKKIDVVDSKLQTIPLEGVSSKGNINIIKENSNTGIGETVGSLSVSLTGAANYTVPFLVPPGINNISPKIALSYNSQGGNGIAGYGWNISGISMISRTSATKYHDGEIDGVDFNNLDRFVLDGQRLMLKSGTYGANGAQYETENFSNLKIVSHGVSPYGANYGPAYFIVHYPNGAKAYYGNSGDSRTHTGYAITYWENPQGIRIDYEYSSSNNSQSISKIKYGHTNTTAPINEIRFLYYSSTERNRWEKSYVGNIPLTRKDVLRSVEVYTNNNRVRSYSLGYDPSYLGYDRLLYLKEYTGDFQDAHAAIFFDYTKSSTSVTVNDITTDLGLVNIEQRNAETVSMDFTGNGKMDFLVYPKNDKTKFWLFKDIQSGTNNSPSIINTGVFETIFPTKWINHENKVVEGQGVTIVKKGNSGTVHFNVYSNSTIQPMTLNYTKTWNSGTYTYQSDCNNSTQREIPKEYISGDFNGDGLTDVLAVGKPYVTQYCNEYDCGEGGSFGEISNEPDELDPNPGGSNGTCCSCNNTTVRNSTVYLIDLNRNITINFANQVGYLLDTIGNEDKLLTGDFNGDGKSDLVHITNGKLNIYTLNNNNNQLSLLWSVNDLGITTSDPLLFGDFNGDGKTDFLDPVANGSYSFRTFLSTGTTFVQETKNQPFKYQKTTYQPHPISNYSAFYGYNLVPLDVNGDGKTDIIEYNTTTYNNGLNGVQTVKIYNNQGQSSNYSNAEVRFVFGGTTTKNGNTEHFPIPIFLTSNQPNKNLDFATISNQWITSFSFTQDHREDVLLRSVDNNGVKYEIEYESLNSLGSSQTYSALNTSTYPNVDIKTAPSTKVVSSLQRIVSGTPTLTKKYAYEGAVYNVEGLGFLGFQGVSVSNWHTGSSDRIYTVSKYDPLLRGAMIASYSQANYYTFTIPTSYYISKTTYQYNSSLAANKVFKLSTTSVLSQNNLDGTYTNTMYQYDSFNNPTLVTTNYVGGSSSRSITYDNSTGINYYIGRPITVAHTSTIGGNTFNSEEQFVYTGNFITQKKTKGNGTPFDIEAYEYDVFGNITKITTTPNGENSREVSFEYDSSGRFLLKTIDVEGLETMYEYNTSTLTGSLKKEINPFGQETSFMYDNWERPIKVTDYLGNQISSSYEEPGYSYIVSNLNDDGSESKVFYDPLERITKIQQKDILGQWISKSYEYDKFDRIARESEPYTGSNPSQWNEITYDFYGRPITQTLHTGRIINISYNGTSVTVDDGVKTITSNRDGMGNTLSVTDPGGTINYTYYGNGNLKSADNNGVLVSMEQDGWGRKTKLTDPSAGIYEYTYNGYGEVINETNPKGAVDYTYSPIGKLLDKHITGDNNTDMLIQYSYHPVNKMISNITLTSSDGNNSIYDYTYDSHQRVTVMSELNPHANFTKKYTYDSFGRVDTEQYDAKLLLNNKISSKKVKYDYQNGGLKMITDVATNEAIWNLTGVNARGQITSSTVGNNIQKSNSYDTYGYITNKIVSTSTGSSSQIIMNLGTSFDAQRGTLNSRTNSMFSWSETFGYDNLDRLITFNDNKGDNSLSYDDLGRITSNNKIGDYNYSGTSYQVSTIDLNNQGDLYYQQNSLQQVKFNAFKKPFEINEEGKEKIGFQYNAFMGRSHMFYGGTEDDIYQRDKRKHYSFDNSMEISYDTASDTTLFVTYIGGSPYTAPTIWRSEQTNSSTDNNYYYLHRDYLGSILLITDSNGNAKEKRHFDAWGNIVQLTDGNDITLEKLTFLDRGYTGHEHLQGVKLIHMNGRLYDPNLKRFLSPDNFIQDISNTQNFNRYGYVLNNPLMYIDPSGEMTEDPGGLTNGQQIGLGATLASLGALVDWNSVGDWLGTNIKSIGRDIANGFREAGRFLRRIFGGKKRNSTSIEFDTFTNLTIDPLAGSSFGNSLSLFNAEGSSNNEPTIKEQILDGLQALNYDIGQQRAEDFINMIKNKTGYEFYNEPNSFKHKACAYYIDGNYPKYTEYSENSADVRKEKQYIESDEVLNIKNVNHKYSQILFIKKTPEEYNVYRIYTNSGLIGADENNRKFTATIRLMNIQGENITKYIFYNKKSFEEFFKHYITIPSNQGFDDYVKYYNKIHGTSYYQQ